MTGRLRSSNPSGTTRHRGGAVMALVLVVLVLMSALMGEFIRRAVRERRQLRQEFHYQQTVQLAEAGLLRLSRQIRSDSDYQGEVWAIPAGRIHPENSGVVEIQVIQDRATVTARYPANKNLPMQITRTTRLAQ